VPEVQWTSARLIAVFFLLGQQQQFHPYAFASHRGGPFFASPLVDPLQPLPNPLQPLPNPLQPRDPLSSFRHAMPGNCQNMSQFGLTASNSWGYGSTAGYAGYLPGPLSSCATQASFPPPLPPPPPPPPPSSSLASFAGTASMNTPTAPDSTAGTTVASDTGTGTTAQQDAFSAVSSLVPDSTTTSPTDPLDPLSSLLSGTPSQRYQDYVSPKSLSTDSSTTESPVHEEQAFGQNYGNYFPTPGVLPSILYSQLYGNQFQNSESPEQRAVADSCSVRQEEVRPYNNVWRPY
ncbi:splicing factor 1-like, partial [Hylaeus anthracinus]|uniref:splicing factor 1-like n=1 Tax=Hylaeus anthracinus TaxID=313031 RepID=UPI0023B95528